MTLHQAKAAARTAQKVLTDEDQALAARQRRVTSRLLRAGVAPAVLRERLDHAEEEREKGGANGAKIWRQGQQAVPTT